MKRQTKPRKRRSTTDVKVTPTTVAPDVRKREDKMIDAGGASDWGMFKALGFDRIGMNYESFRGYASKRRRATRTRLTRGRTTGSTERTEATPDLALLELYRAMFKQFVDAMIDGMIALGQGADVEAPR